MAISLSLQERCEAVFLGLIEAAAVTELTGYGLVPAKVYDPEADRPLPFVLFDAGRQEMKRKGPPGAHEVFLKIFVATNAEGDPEATAHNAGAAAVLELLNDRRANRTGVNAAEARFFLYDYFLEGQATRQIETGEWETEITLRVVCQLR